MNIDIFVFIQQCAALAIWILIVAAIYSQIEKLFPDLLTKIPDDDPALKAKLAKMAGAANEKQADR